MTIIDFKQPPPPDLFTDLLAKARTAGMGNLCLDMPLRDSQCCASCEWIKVCRARTALSLWLVCEKPTTGDLMTLAELLDENVVNVLDVDVDDVIEASIARDDGLVRLNVTFSKKQHAWVNDQALRQSVNFSAVLRKILSHARAQLPNPQPKRSRTGKSKRTTLLVYDWQDTWVRELAREHGVGISATVRWLVERMKAIEIGVKHE